MSDPILKTPHPRDVSTSPAHKQRRSLTIHDLEVRASGESTELSAYLDDFRLWFRFPADIPIAPCGDPFLTVALPEAMSRGHTLEIDQSAPISPFLLERVARVQDIYHSWNPELLRVPIECKLSAPPAPNAGVASFYSGGVDSSYTVLRHRDEITHLVLIEGFDFQDSPESAAERYARQKGFAELWHKDLVPVAANFRAYTETRRLQWFLVHGNCLAALCLALGFQRSYIPATHTYQELFPWGTHPLLDPLWSNGRTEIVHDGAGARRTEKLRLITRHSDVLKNLRVCWRDSNRNCGTCTKCLRDMITLRLLSAPTPAFPRLGSPRTLNRMQVRDLNECAFLDHNIELAREIGDREIYRKLTSIRWRYELGELLASVDRVLLARTLRRLYRFLFKPEWLTRTATLGPKNRR